MSLKLQCILRKLCYDHMMATHSWYCKFKNLFLKIYRKAHKRKSELRSFNEKKEHETKYLCVHDNHRLYRQHSIYGWMNANSVWEFENFLLTSSCAEMKFMREIFGCCYVLNHIYIRGQRITLCRNSSDPSFFFSARRHLCIIKSYYAHREL